MPAHSFLGEKTDWEKTDRYTGAKIVINFSIAVLTMSREFQYIKPTETF